MAMAEANKHTGFVFCSTWTIGTNIKQSVIITMITMQLTEFELDGCAVNKIRLCQSIRIYVKNIRAEFHPDPV